MRNIAFAGAAVLLASSVALPETDPAQDVARLWEMKQLARIKAVDDALDGVLGVASIDLTSGRVFAYNADAVFPTASSIKIPIMIQVFRDEKAGKFSFADKVTLGPKDNAGGSGGPLQKALDKGTVTVTVRDLLDDMIQYSDNSATNRLIEMVGMDRVNALIREFGLVRTRLRRKMMDTAAAARGDENVSTPLEMTRIVRLVYNNQSGRRAVLPRDARHHEEGGCLHAPRNPRRCRGRLQAGRPGWSEDRNGSRLSAEAPLHRQRNVNLFARSREPGRASNRHCLRLFQ